MRIVRLTMPTRLRVGIVTLIRSRCPGLIVRADRPLSLTPQPALARMLRCCAPAFRNSNSQTIGSPPQTGLVVTTGLSHCQRGAEVTGRKAVCPDGTGCLSTFFVFPSVTVDGSASDAFFPVVGDRSFELAPLVCLFEKDGAGWACARLTVSERQAARPLMPTMNPTHTPRLRLEHADESPPGRRFLLV